MSEKFIPQVMPESPILVDRRLVTRNHCNFANEVYIPRTIEEHKARCEFVRRRLLLSAGMKPGYEIPQNPARISEGKLYHGVLIKEVEIETLPGLRLTGSLYMPEKLDGAAPGILCPHGHWTEGRVSTVVRGGVVMRCFELARLGFVVFAYDMIGYNDNNEFPHFWEIDLLKRGAVSGISPFGLQTANSMRALDFLCGLDQVDEKRIGCTGASGGASQTWFLAALDDRIKAAVPVCMLSSHFMGGCACEEGPIMRVTGLTSFDIVSCLAPRPILLPSVTRDWTNLNPVYEIPAMREVYKLYNAGNRVENFHCEEDHNYNRNTREYVYAFFVRELMGEDRGKKIAEEDIEPPTPDYLWFGGKEPAKATQETIDAAFAKINAYISKNVLETGDDFAAFKASRIELLREMLETEQPPARNVVERTNYHKIEIPGGMAHGRTFSRRKVGDIVSGLELRPEKSDGKNSITLLITDGSYLDFIDGNSKESVAADLMKQGKHSYVIELLGTGNNSWQLKYALRDSSKISIAFNEPLFSMRVQDIITVCTFMEERGYEEIELISSGSAAPAALAAAALLDLPLTCDLAGIDDTVWHDDINFQPLIARFGGIPALLMLNAAKGTFTNVPEQYKKYCM